MADGTTKAAGDLKIGDEVFGYDAGLATKIRVTAVEPARKQCVELEFRDKSVARCSTDHRFPVWNHRRQTIEIKEVHEVLSETRPGKTNVRHLFLVPNLVDFGPAQSLPIAPYFLGLLLGDGGMSDRTVSFSTTDQVLLDYVKQQAKRFHLTAKQTDYCTYRLSSGKRRDAGGHNCNLLIRALRAMKLMGCTSHAKFIPKDYLLSDAESRLQLLAGLIDTDGHVYNKGRMIEYCTMSKRLANDVQFLVRSLGGYCGVGRGHVGQYRLGITMNRRIPTRVPRKAYDGELKRDKTRIGLRRWNLIGEQDCVHISVDADNELFLLDNFVATHNTMAGSAEFLRWVLGMPKTLSWAVAPTFNNLEEAEDTVVGFMEELNIPYRRRRNQHEYALQNGAKFRLRSADKPNNLRGPNITGILWIDELCFLSEDAWTILRARISATQAGLLTTSTPSLRNWAWNEYALSGLPASAPYGEFESLDGMRYIAHFPTWAFPWVPDDEIDRIRAETPREIFERDYGAKFTAAANQAFDHIEECIDRSPPPMDFSGATVMGLDLARQQDFTFYLVMMSDGRTLDLGRWTRIGWRVQKPKIIKLAQRWNATVAIDVSNVGNPIAEDLEAAGIPLLKVDMNAPQIKTAVVEGLRIAFEQGAIKIPDPRKPWSPSDARHLLNELEWYEATLTPGNRVRYSAPKGLTDDGVIALGLANYGRARGAAGGIEPQDICVTRRSLADWVRENAEEEDEERAPLRTGPRVPRQPRIRTHRRFRRIFSGGRSSIGIAAPAGPFWGG